MEILLILLVVPFCWPFVAKALWGHTISFQELVLNIILAGVLAWGMWAAGRYAQMHDVEIVNGAVISKARETTSCEHSYSCRCSTDSKGNRSCDTCYEHLFDYDWVLRTSIAGHSRIEIDRVDRQGSREPSRFTAAQVGDPVAAENSHVNYVKAAPNSLFHDKGEVLTELPIPEYPNNVFNYHYVNRALVAGRVAVPDLAAWNKDIAMTLRDLGRQKQVNFVVVFAGTPNATYAQALERNWINGKKNDVIVVLGTPEYPKLSWVRVLSWTDRQDFKVALRDRILDLGTVDRHSIIKAMTEETAAKFERKSMEDFAYLKYEIDPPLWVSVLAFILSTGSSIGLSVYFRHATVTFASFFGALLAGILMLIPFARRR